MYVYFQFRIIIFGDFFFFFLRSRAPLEFYLIGPMPIIKSRKTVDLALFLIYGFFVGCGFV